MEHLLEQWDAARNAPYTPEMVSYGSRLKVWWRCEQGHEWQSLVKSRTDGCNCPVCTNRMLLTGENDLASRFPEVAVQWDTEKNDGLTPEQVTLFSNRVVWWRCGRGHSYRAAVGARTNSGSSCPYCAGKKVLAGFNDLRTLEPQVAAQWHPTLNGALTAEMVTPNSHKRVWWLCAQGHAWKAVVYSRAGANKCGCPVCAGKHRAARSGGYIQP
nr:zinc-ribbon domain-containing protein [Lawsonibacter celer]